MNVTENYGDVALEQPIENDEDFMDRMSEIKSLLRDGTPISELKSREAELLRTKIVDILKYVMSKIEEEETGTQVSSSSQQEPSASMSPEGNTASMVGGKKKKGKSKRVKGGAPMDLPRIQNTTGITSITKTPYDAIMTNPDVYMGLNMHNAFTAGNLKGFSSVSGMPPSELNSMLPSYGTAK